MENTETSQTSSEHNSEASKSKDGAAERQKYLQQCADGITMRRVKRGQISKAQPVHLVDGNTQLQYHTCGFCKIVPPKLKTG